MTPFSFWSDMTKIAIDTQAANLRASDALAKANAQNLKAARAWARAWGIK